MASRLWLIAPLLLVIAVALVILFVGFGFFLWTLLASLFRTFTGGYCPSPLC